MKKVLVFLFLVFIFYVPGYSQQYKYIYYLDKNLTSTNAEEAVFVGKGELENSLVRVDYFYKNGGYLFMKIHFTDSSLNNMEGNFQSFYLNGRIENEGTYASNLEQGSWLKYDSLGYITDSTVYDKGLVLVTAKYSYYKPGKIGSYEFVDSSKKEYVYKFYSDEGLRVEVIVSGNNGVLKTYGKDGIKTKSISSAEKIEASFAGQDKAYRNFLQKELDANVPVMHGAPSGTYHVVIRFWIDVDGSVREIVPETNFGYGMEDEAMRVIKKSPAWIPAKFGGTPVPAYRRQPITFFVDNGDGQKRN